MYADRLELLCKHVEENVKDEEFDMRHWARRTLRGIDGIKEETFCGTVCCLMGHAASMPEFQSLGLRLRWTKGVEFDDEGRRIDAADPFAMDSNSSGYPVDYYSFYAAAYLFDLNYDDAYYLFSVPPRKMTREEAVARIRKFIARKLEEENDAAKKTEM